MLPLTQFAGFLCEEGQAAADAKQLGYTLLSIVLFSLGAWLIRRNADYRDRPIKKVAFWLVVVLGVIISGLVLVIGPFFYNSWGCKGIFLNNV